MEYRVAARELADAAGALAETIPGTSHALIEFRFALVRAAYAKCKGAHAELLTDSGVTDLPAPVLQDVGRVHT